MNLSRKTRALIETAIEAVFGLAAATPVLLSSTGVNSQIGAGATLLAVSVGVTNLMQVPAVERLLDRMLGISGNAQPLTALATEIQGVESVIAEHLAQPHTASSGLPSGPASGGTAAAGEASASAQSPASPEVPASASAAGSTPPAADVGP